MLRSILSVIVGYVAIAVLLSVTSGILFLVLPQSTVSPEGGLPAVGWIIFNLVYGTAFAAVGGYITARIAQRAEVRHALALGALIVVLGILYAFSATQNVGDAPQAPLWYVVILPVTGFVGAWLGGWLRAKQAQGMEG